jgi:hypothetical protein
MVFARRKALPVMHLALKGRQHALRARMAWLVVVAQRVVMISHFVLFLFVFCLLGVFCFVIVVLLLSFNIFIGF